MVDYPIKIPPGSENLLAGRVAGGRGRRCGPFFHGTNIYTFLLEAVTKWSDLHIEVWKSEDQGETWAQQNSGNDPDIEASSSTAHFDAQADFDLDVIPRIYVLYTDTTGDLRVHPFNTSNDSWETVGAAGANPFSVSSMQMARRPVGINGIEFPIAYAGAQDSSFNRVYYTVYRPATSDWLTPVRLFGTAIESEHYAAKSRASGPTSGFNQGRVHFFARQGAGDGSLTQRTVHKSVESNDTINLQENVNAASGSPRVGTAKDGSEIIVPYIKSNQNLHVARATSSPSMVWAEEDVLLGESEFGNTTLYATQVVELTNSMRTYFALSDDFATQASINYSDDGGAGSWGERQIVHDISDPTIAFMDALNVTALGVVVGDVFNFKLATLGLEQAYYTQEGVLGPDAGMINQVDTVSGKGYVIS